MKISMTYGTNRVMEIIHTVYKQNEPIIWRWHFSYINQNPCQILQNTAQIYLKVAFGLLVDFGLSR